MKMVNGRFYSSKKTYLLFTILCFLFTIFYSLIPTVGYAQESPAFSLGIFPPILEINADPPSNIESQISIQNLSDSPQSLDIIFRSFRQSPKNNGEIEYLRQDQVEGPDPLIFQKIKVFDQDNEVKSITLEPLEAKDLKLGIGIEEGAPIGDYYFSVIFLSKRDQTFTQSALDLPGGIGTNVILSVGKKGETKGNILDYSSPFFLSSGPVPFTLLLKNNSNHYIVPRGSITVKNMFGKDMARLDILPQYILSMGERYMIDTDQASPGASMTKTIQGLNLKRNALIWPEKFLLGLYTAKMHVKLSDQGPDFERSISFIAFPSRIIFAVSFFAFILLGIYLKVRKKV